jgi:hypothetical protein
MSTRANLAALMARPLPEGWIRWSLAERYACIGNDAAMVTIDAERRCFRAGGNVTHGTTLEREYYTGRGWLKRLHDDAVAWLREQERPARGSSGGASP